MKPGQYLLLCCILAAAISTLPRPAAAQTHPLSLPPGFEQELLADGLGPVTAFAVAPDGRIFIARKHGSVKVYRDGRVLPGPFIDLAGETNHYADRGLMGIAVHPDFPNPAYVYLAYAYEPAEARSHEPSGARTARVVRVMADPTNLDRHLPGSAVVLLGAGGTVEATGDLDHGDRPPFSCTAADGSPVRDCLPVDGPSHTVDGLVFGPDGALYVSTGDATLQPETSVRAQDIDSLAGKVLRIDPISGEGYQDNPFFDGDPSSNRSKAYALGLRNPFRFTFEPGSGRLIIGDVGGEQWEEINRGGPGANFGWPCYEGPQRLNSSPLCSALARGAVTFALHSYPHDGPYRAAIGGDFYTGDRYPASYRGAYFFADHNAAAILTLSPGPDGTLAARDFAGNAAAVVQLTAGPEGDILVLSFVDGTLSRIRYSTGAAPSPTATTAPAGTPDPSAPIVRILAPAAGSRWRIGESVNVRGEAVDADGKRLTGAQLRWEAVLHHNEHIHPDYFHAEGESGRLTFEPHGDNVYLELCLTATDRAGANGRACVDLYPDGPAGVPTPSAPLTPAVSEAGRLLRERWTDVGGAAVAELTEHPRYPDKPDETDTLNTLDVAGLGKDYGQRLRGFLLPPADGDYRFWIAGDDSAELWLSSSEDPAAARLIAAAPQWTPRYAWENDPRQASAAVSLQAGRRYYLEVRHKQADGKDHVAVAWQPPDGERAVIAGSYLAPWK